MSRFFATTKSDSSSESNSDNIQSDSDINVSNALQQNDSYVLGSEARFTFEDSDSEEDKRVVRTLKEKNFDKIQSIIKRMKNLFKNKDWNKILNEYESLQNLMINTKMQQIIRNEGIPNEYLKIMVYLMDFVETNYSDKAYRKKLSSFRYKAFSKLRQTLKKTNLYSKEINEYKLNPIEEEEEKSDFSQEESDEEEDSVESETDSSSSDSSSENEKTLDQDDDDSEWSDESESESDSGLEIENSEMITRDFWVKKVKQEKEIKPRAEKENKRLKSKKENLITTNNATKDNIQKIEWNSELILQKIKEYSKTRGKATKDRVKFVNELEEMKKYTQIPVVKVNMLCLSIGILNDLNLNKTNFMPIETWKNCLNLINELVDILKTNPDIKLRQENSQNPQKQTLNTIKDIKPENTSKTESEIQLENEALKNIGNMRGNLYSFVHALNFEYEKSLQFIEFNTKEYSDRLNDEKLLLNLLYKIREYFLTHKNQKTNVSFISSLILNHIYTQKSENIEEMSDFIFKNGTKTDKITALLQVSTHEAIEYRYYKARDLLLMSHLSEFISQANVLIQVLYNRSLVYVSIAAFFVGDFEVSLKILSEIYASSNVKELLAQGVSYSRRTERDINEENLERKRVYPPHLHIPFDLLESIHLLSAMFIDHLALVSSTEHRRHISSRFFKRIYEQYQSQPIHGKPESVREIILEGTQCLLKGDWKKCHYYIMSLKIWSFFEDPEKIRALITQRIKESALQAFLITYGPYYANITLDNLVEKFEFSDKKTVIRIVSKMIAMKDLRGSINQPNQTLRIHQQSFGYLQKMALFYADKLNGFIEQNEKLLELSGALRSSNYKNRVKMSLDSESLEKSRFN